MWGTPSTTLVRSRKLFEEWAEFTDAVLNLDGTQQTIALAEEAGDLVVTLIGVLLSSQSHLNTLADFFIEEQPIVHLKAPIEFADNDRLLQRLALDITEFLRSVYTNRDAVHNLFWALDTIFQICHVRGVENEALYLVFRSVMDKNAAKTHTTHYLDSKGMVARRPNGVTSNTATLSD
jgi:hypothetical protein